MAEFIVDIARFQARLAKFLNMVELDDPKKDFKKNASGTRAHYFAIFWVKNWLIYSKNCQNSSINGRISSRNSQISSKISQISIYGRISSLSNQNFPNYVVTVANFLVEIARSEGKLAKFQVKNAVV